MLTSVFSEFLKKTLMDDAIDRFDYFSFKVQGLSSYVLQGIMP